MKNLILVRGLPGSGKSTLSKLFGGEHLETDQYFIKNGEYHFDHSKLKLAHNWCLLRCEHLMMENTEKVVVSNTFTQEWEMESYFNIAKKYGYTVSTVITENRHGGINVHDVPNETLEKMRNRFQVKL